MIEFSLKRGLLIYFCIYTFEIWADLACFDNNKILTINEIWILAPFTTSLTNSTVVEISNYGGRKTCQPHFVSRTLPIITYMHCVISGTGMCRWWGNKTNSNVQIKWIPWVDTSDKTGWWNHTCLMVHLLSRSSRSRICIFR